MARTKIVCTIGPAVGSVEMMVKLIEAGMNVARVNFSHGTHEEHRGTIARLKEARAAAKVPLAIMLDMKGPKIRIGTIDGGPLKVERGTRLRLVAVVKESSDIPVHPFEALSEVRQGMRILFDDGYIISQVVARTADAITVEVQNAGLLKNGKGVNIPGAKINLPAMTEADLADLKFGCEQDVDLVAASFIRSAHHVLAIKEVLAKEGRPDLLVIAKIESTQGVENFESIVQAADGIMVARGDLGVEVDLARVPKLQKMMIRKCLQACKTVITATQMLESMINNPRPTRAEVSDVANAIYDGTSAIMLSAETAVGKYPLETVRCMKEIVRETEADYDYQLSFEQRSSRDYHDISSAVSQAAVRTAYGANARAIFAFTGSGMTARLVSRLRPGMPIIALTFSEKVYNQLAVDWGVIPLLERCEDEGEALEALTRNALEKGLVSFGDVIVVTSGAPLGRKGSTNMMRVESIGPILVRGYKGSGSKVTGKIAILLTAEGRDPEELRGRIAVILHCDETFLPVLKLCAGVILQNYLGDVASERYAEMLAKTCSLSVMTRADGAMAVLREGVEVVLDPTRGLVYTETT